MTFTGKYLRHMKLIFENIERILVMMTKIAPCLRIPSTKPTLQSFANATKIKCNKYSIDNGT